MSDAKIDQKMIDRLFEAARWAPSNYNEQPWRFVYATKDDGKEREVIESLLVDGNAWAKSAYLLIVSFTKKTFAKNDKPNRMALHDLGAANLSIALQATDMGLVTHQMGGFDHENVNTILGVPDDFLPGSMMAISQPTDSKGAPAELIQRDEKPRSRASTVIAFRGKWGQ